MLVVNLKGIKKRYKKNRVQPSYSWLLEKVRGAPAPGAAPASSYATVSWRIAIPGIGYHKTLCRPTFVHSMISQVG